LHLQPELNSKFSLIEDAHFHLGDDLGSINRRIGKVLKFVEAFPQAWWAELHLENPDAVDAANREVFDILYTSGRLLTFLGQQKYLAGSTPRYITPSLDQAAFDTVFPTEESREPAAVDLGPSVRLFQRALEGLKSQADSDRERQLQPQESAKSVTHQEVQNFLRTVLD
jgi:hypothetical protein